MSITEPPAKITGEVLRGMRTEVGIPLRKMAALVGCSFQHLARVETGERDLTPELAVKFSHAIAQHLIEHAA